MLWQLSELKKANDRVLEAEKSKFCAEAEKKVLEEKVWEIGKTLGATDDKLREAEVHKRLLEKEAQSYKDDVRETQQKMEEENMRLSSDLAELRLQEEAARKKVQETERERVQAHNGAIMIMGCAVHSHSYIPMWSCFDLLHVHSLCRDSFQS